MFETRNKLKRRKTCKDATTVHNAETEAGEKKAEDTNKCPSRSDGITITREHHHPQCEKNCVPNIKLAPIFLRTTQQNSSAAAKDDIIITREHHPQYEKNCVPNIKLAPVFLRTTTQKNSSAAKRTDRAPVLHRSSGTTAQTRHHEVTEEPPPTTTTTSSRMMKERKGPTLSSWKGELSVSAQNSCLEEITEANPSFPLRRVFLALQKKHRDGLRDIAQAGDPLDHIGEKRKRPFESDASDNNALKRRQSSVVSKEGSATGHCPSPPDYNDPGVVQPRRGRLSRTYRLKQQVGEKTCQDVKDEPKPNLTGQTESASVVFEAGSSLQRNSIIEDILWTERYSPQHSNEVIDNSSSVKKLHSWLKKWKLRADCDERKKELEMKRDESSNESWDCGDFQGEAGFEEKREQLCTTMLITGPPGIGKTSSVYACAQELGFKVFEVNSSSQRSGHNVLSQLKEAVQSHLVETSGKDALKPAYLNIYNTTNVSTTKHDTSSGKNLSSAKHVISTSKRRGQKIVKSCCKRKPSPATIMLANFFKMKAKADRLHSGVLSEKPASDISSVPGNEMRNWSTATERKKMATSLILFEEADVIFDDDIGFLTAVKTFMRNTKRPVILTTSDPLFRERFDGHFEVTIYKTPSLVNVCSYLRLVCLAESVRTELGDVTNLLRLSRGDIRSCLLQLQFWVHSGGQLAPQGESMQKDPTRTLFSNTSEMEDISDNPHLPPCDVGCTASMLGFQAETRRSLLTLLKTNPDMNTLLNILAESWRRGVPLLYSNMELLLPPTSTAQGSSTCAYDVTCSGLQSDRTAPARQPQNQHLVEVIDLTGTTSVKSVRNFSRLGRRKCMPTVFDDRSSSGVAAKTRTTSPSLMGAQYRATCSNDKPKAEDSVTKLASHCLDALIDFIDHMSYLDSTVPTEESHVSGPCRSAEFVWTGAEIRDGLLDEMREEDSGRCEQEERTLEIQAALEGLAFQTCWRKASEVWTKVQGCRRGLRDKEWQRLVERFTIPVPFHRQSFNFSSTFFCDPSAAQRRYELSKKVICSPFFSVLGNRRAVTVEYMPMLRSICRSERAEQKGQPPGRFVYYLSDIGLGLSKSTIQLLSEDFP